MLIPMTSNELAAHISRQLLHTNNPKPVDFYKEFDPARNWKSGGYRAAYSNFVDADMILLNRHEGGMLMGIDCSHGRGLDSLKHFVGQYFTQECIPGKVWVEVSEKTIVITHGGKLAHVYTSDPNMAVHVIDGYDEPETEADILRELSMGHLHELYSV